MVTKENIAIIIPFHKNVDMLRLSIHTLEESIVGEMPQVIIVGNNNNSNELNLSKNEFAQYNIYKIPKDLFWPGAINFGACQTDKEYLLFCDPDLFYTENWLDSLLDCYNRHKNVGVVSAKIINPLNNRIMDFGMGYNHFNTIHIGKDLPFNHPTTLKDRKVQAACGAVFLTPHKLFENVNGIDISMPYIYCDNDYSVKISELGFDTWVAADSIVYHKGNTDAHNSKYENFKYLREDSKASFYAKNRDKIKINISECFSYMHNWIKNNDFRFQYGYYLYNFCTLLDSEEYIKLFPSLGLSLVNRKNITVSQRDIAQINLCDYIPARMIYSNISFVYFVDSFMSLYNNDLYFRIRNISNDIVIDRQCNILPLSQIRNKLV
jgi:GT2 family glycosyltransferase